MKGGEFGRNMSGRSFDPWLAGISDLRRFFVPISSGIRMTHRKFVGPKCPLGLSDKNLPLLPEYFDF